ncbi:hypothetical protein ACFO0O_00550 [Cobetia amphilecti]|uniref:Secreted protein n=1 Tax=Cobetia amphilecti TaxID=1055104 RepID=A0ABT6UUN7_9GAMM|nr:hypothetical protein [Cobetia amphilecti]MDI5886065.1 hypothetical protein [Cobetia amphilecti]
MNTNASTQSARSSIAFALITGGLIALASLSQQAADQQQLSAADTEYCEMTALWQQDARAGFAENQRTGWPDFRENAATLCTPILSADNHQLALR